MARRIQINEQVEIRQLTDDKGLPTPNFGVYSTEPGKEGFLKLGGKPIMLEKNDSLVLPGSHQLDALDLTALDSKGEKPAAILAPALIVENRGNSIELAGKNLSVMGNVTVTTTAYALADMEIRADRAITAASSVDKSHEIGGRTLTYGKESITALFNGRIDFIDASSGDRLLKLDGMEDQAHASDRVAMMQQAAMQRAERIMLMDDKDKRRAALEALGAPPETGMARESGLYHPKEVLTHKSEASLKQFLLVENETEQDTDNNKKKPLPFPPPIIADGREKASDRLPEPANLKKGPVTQDEVNDAMSHNVMGLPNGVLERSILDMRIDEAKAAIAKQKAQERGELKAHQPEILPPKAPPVQQPKAPAAPGQGR